MFILLNLIIALSFLFFFYRLIKTLKRRAEEKNDVNAETMLNNIKNQADKLAVKFMHGTKEMQEHFIVQTIGNNAYLKACVIYRGG